MAWVCCSVCWRGTSLVSVRLPGNLGQVTEPDAESGVAGLERKIGVYLRGLDHAGVVLGVIGFLGSLTPSLLPRPWAIQGVLSGIGAATAYGLGVLLSWASRRLGAPEPGRTLRRRLWIGIGVVAAVVVPIVLAKSMSWQDESRRAVALPAKAHYVYLAVLPIAALVAVGLLAAARTLHAAYLMVSRVIARVAPPLAARLVAAVLVTTLVLTAASGLFYRGFVSAMGWAYSGYDRSNYAGIVQPTSTLRSGGPSSLVPWESLGRKGRQFVGSGPTPLEISRLTGRPAIEPIRVYAGLKSAPSLQGEADAVLGELKRTGAFHRSLLAVATTSGTGWVDPTLADPLEYMFGGDTAIASMQYSVLPSWISFLVDKTRARQAGRELFNTIYDYWSTLPSAQRPRLVVFGESLGAFGGSSAFSGVADLTARTSGALFAGPPNDTQLWRELTDARQRGSLERLPVYDDGRTVRFAASASDLQASGGSLLSPRVVFLQHASDPVVWWSTKLVWRKPDWLRESRGPDVAPQMHWVPFLSFWQVTGDLTISFYVPAGHGHHYGTEVATAWAAILRPPHWTTADTEALGRV